ncbi:uncharacterized protein LOC110854131 isoform X2 [Folsomia candida]|uniref:uncharacterized protein LOC110854131 isoform X2 n=1 Tax=Folsomia candida TaxID=158441 RepID=UPI000B8F5274|nr:uncharacterized protein LOC110854131 isoform X2 [Folsomia candida]
MSHLQGIIILILKFTLIFTHGSDNDVELRPVINYDDISADVTFCQTYYPYSYSKCLRICSSHSEPTCVDDDLCVCDTNDKYSSVTTINEKQTLQNKFGVTTTADCKQSIFCKESCQNTVSQNGRTFTTGVLCVQTTKDYGLINMCVCRKTNF